MTLLHRLAVGALVVHIGLGMVRNLTFLAVFQLRVGWFVEPAGLVAGGAGSAELLRWAAAADLLSYYLPTAVLAYVLWRGRRPDELRPARPVLRRLVGMDHLAARAPVAPIAAVRGRRLTVAP